jgi:hypothetical protein
LRSARRAGGIPRSRLNVASLPCCVACSRRSLTIDRLVAVSGFGWLLILGTTLRPQLNILNMFAIWRGSPRKAMSPGCRPAAVTCGCIGNTVPSELRACEMSARSADDRARDLTDPDRSGTFVLGCLRGAVTGATCDSSSPSRRRLRLPPSRLRSFLD